MILDFTEDTEGRGYGKVTKLEFWGTAVATGIPELEEVHFALFEVDCERTHLGYLWLQWNPLKRMWERFFGYCESVKDAVHTLHFHYPEAQFTFRLTFLKPDGKPQIQDADGLADYEGMAIMPMETFKKLSKEGVNG